MTNDKVRSAVKLSAIDRRSVVAGGLGAIVAPSVLRVIPANAQSKGVKLGLVSPHTGPLAGFGEADGFILDQVKGILAKGLPIGGKTYQVEIVAKDSQSSGTRAAEVASELILHDKVDLLLAQGTPDTTNPVADQAEVNEVPCVTTNCPWQPYFFGRNGDPKKGFTWTYHFFWGLEDVIAAFLALWDGAPVNKTVGGLFPNDADGNAWGDPKLGLPPALAQAGYKLIDPGRYQVMNNDFTSQISQFKAAGCRDRHRQYDPAGFLDLLVAGGAAGLSSQDRDHRQGVVVSLGGQFARSARQRADQRNLVDAEPSVQIRADGRKCTLAHRRLCPSDQTAVVAADRLPARSVRSGDRRAQAHQRASIRRRSSTRSWPPITTRLSAQCAGPASRSRM